MSIPTQQSRPPAIASPTDAQLTAWFQKGELLGQIANSFGLRDFAEFQAIACRCAALSTAGHIDLLALIESDALDAHQNDFFTIQGFFVQALPDLAEPLPRMLAVVETLVKQGGSDMCANQPNAALRSWLQKDRTRAETLIAAAIAGDQAAKTNLTFALEALAEPVRAREILQIADPHLRAGAMTALSRIPDADSKSRLVSIRSLGEALGDGTDDMLCANVVGSVLAIASQDDAVHADEVSETLRIALTARGEGALNRAAFVLWVHRVARHPELLPVLLEALQSLNPAHKGTIKELDYGLRATIEDGLALEALDFLAAVLVRNKDRLEAREFDSVWPAILAAPPKLLSHWMVNWLSSGENVLGKAVFEALAKFKYAGNLVLDRAVFPTSAVELEYLARKATGWLMPLPVHAGTVLVAILGLCDGETAAGVVGLLVNPLLRNSPELREPLAATPPDDPARSWINAALEENERYLAALREMPDIPELRPPENHRHLNRLRLSAAIQTATKAAEEQSVLMNLVHRSTLLHGARSLSYIQDVGGEWQPIEAALGHHEFSMALPRLEALDPVGLQYMLIRLRTAERPK